MRRLRMTWLSVLHSKLSFCSATLLGPTSAHISIVIDQIISGSLPFQLLVETLHSLQSVIFPPTDSKSIRLLEQLIKTRGFDPKLAEYDGYSFFMEAPESITYKYWGERISTLQNLFEQRLPRNNFERWFNWQANDGNAFFIALLALLISIIVGIVSIIISALQTWIAWQAWKHPVCNN